MIGLASSGLGAGLGPTLTILDKTLKKLPGPFCSAEVLAQSFLWLHSPIPLGLGLLTLGCHVGGVGVGGGGEEGGEGGGESISHPEIILVSVWLLPPRCSRSKPNPVEKFQSGDWCRPSEGSIFG